MKTNRLERGLRTTFTGLAVNLALAAIKFLAGVLGHSQALVADAVESLADVFSSLIVWRGLVVSAEPPDEDHPYGHGKAEPIATAAVSTLLLVAAGWITVSALRGITEDHPGPEPFTLIVLVLVIAVKETLFRYVLRASDIVQSSAVRSDAWHHRSDAITSGAAFIGISISLVGGKGFESADGWAAIAAACVIALNGWRLLRPALNELMDRSPNRELVDQIRSIARTISGVAAVEKCLVRKMGYQYLVDMHIEVDPEMTVFDAHQIAHDVKDRVRTELPEVLDVLVHIEPLRRGDGRGNQAGS